MLMIITGNINHFYWKLEVCRLLLFGSTHLRLMLTRMLTPNICFFFFRDTKMATADSKATNLNTFINNYTGIPRLESDTCL